MAYKVFTNGSVLNASEINDNLMNQSVMVFSNSTARAAALTSPVEGMLTWLQDVNKYQYRNGSGAWVDLGGGGAILQVVTTAKTDTFTTSSTSYTPITGLSATITPSSATSKILVMAQISIGANSGSTNFGFYKVTRGGTDFYIGDAAGTRSQAVFGGYKFYDELQTVTSNSIIAQDSPASTAALTYRAEVICTSFGTAYVNRSQNDVNNNSVARAASSITVMEVAV